MLQFLYVVQHIIRQVLERLRWFGKRLGFGPCIGDTGVGRAARRFLMRINLDPCLVPRPHSVERLFEVQHVDQKWRLFARVVVEVKVRGADAATGRGVT